MASDDLSQYMGVFLEESAEQLESLEQGLLALESNPDSGAVQQVFRAAHTIKGSSRAMGFTTIGDLTHAMEDVLDEIRSGRAAAVSGTLDTLLEGVDLLRRMTGEIARDGSTSTDPTELTARLRGLHQRTPEAINSQEPIQQVPGPVEAVAEPQVAAPSIGDCDSYEIAVTLAADCVMKSVRAFMVMQAVAPLGEVVATKPSEADLEEERFGDTFSIVIWSDSTAEQLKEAVLSVSEVAGVQFGPRAEDKNSESTEGASAGSQPATVALPPDAPQQRKIDLGVEARGKSPAELRDLAASKYGTATENHTVRIDVARLDSLMNLVGELVIDQTRIAQLVKRVCGARPGDPDLAALTEAAAHFGRTASQMQDHVMKARMQPIDKVFSRFPRMVRDLASQMGKEVDLVIVGRETELDRSVIEVIGDPLVHLIRNSLDHGIELPDQRESAGKPRRGTVWLRARHVENSIVIEIEDDGRGIDPRRIVAKAVEMGVLSSEAAAQVTDREAVNLIFASGFSTAEKITDVSGRGVGMDVVKNNLTRFGAVIDVDSQPGKGTRVTVRVPLTLAIIRGLLLSAGSAVYVLPLASVVEAVRLEGTEIHRVRRQEVVVQRGRTLPLIRLGGLFGGGTAGDPEGGSTCHMVVVGTGDRQVGLVVDDLLGEQEIVIKPLGNFIGEVGGIAGATMLGDGRIGLIVDVSGLVSLATGSGAAPTMAARGSRDEMGI